VKLRNTSHLPCIENILVLGNTAAAVFEKGEKIIQIVLKASSAQSRLPHPVAGDKVPAVHLKNMLGQPGLVSHATGKGQPSCGIAFAQEPGCI